MYNVIASASQGIPRAINPFCGSTLLATVADGSSRVRDSNVHKVMADLDLGELPRREVTVQPSVAASITFPNLLKVTRSEAKSSSWNRWVNGPRFTPRHEST
jgi:hypothetical protein